MLRGNLDDMAAFVEVATEKSFTRAAARLNISPSALSQIMKNLEERLGLRLLNRTTRSVTTTESGERLLAAFMPMLHAMQAQVEALKAERDAPEGVIRLTTSESAIDTILWPKLRKLLNEYPGITIELDVDSRLVDIVAEGYDAGIRLTDSIDRDMISVPVSAPLPVCIVGAPAYLERFGFPEKPDDLSLHRCINLRLPTLGGIYVWELQEAGREIKIKVSGQCIFNTLYNVIQACVDGFGLAYVPQHQVQEHIDNHRLIPLLSAWTPPFPAYHLYYPSRRQPSRAFKLMVEALRFPSVPQNER